MMMLMMLMMVMMLMIIMIIISNIFVKIYGVGDDDAVFVHIVTYVQVVQGLENIETSLGPKMCGDPGSMGNWIFGCFGQDQWLVFGS